MLHTTEVFLNGIDFQVEFEIEPEDGYPLLYTATDDAGENVADKAVLARLQTQLVDVVERERRETGRELAAERYADLKAEGFYPYG